MQRNVISSVRYTKDFSKMINSVAIMRFVIDCATDDRVLLDDTIFGSYDWGFENTNNNCYKAEKQVFDTETDMSRMISYIKSSIS